MSSISVPTGDLVGAIVVHHKNFPDVLETISDLIQEGIYDDHIIVVDNSEDDYIATRLGETLPSSTVYLRLSNLGYANAVNAGVRLMSDLGLERPYTIVATHEVRIATGSVTALLNAMRLQAPRLSYAAMGPTLIMDNQVWSTGGKLSRYLRLPEHYVLNSFGSGQVSERVWLDGAFCLYNTRCLQLVPLNESYFLYFEEVDYHITLRNLLNMPVAWCSSAVVAQSTSGIPSYYLGRNLSLFQSQHGTWWSRRLAVPIVFVRGSVKRLMFGKRKTRFSPLDFCRGWRSAQTAEGKQP